MDFLKLSEGDGNQIGYVQQGPPQGEPLNRFKNNSFAEM